MCTIEKLTRAAESRGQVNRFSEAVQELTLKLEGTKSARQKAIMEGRKDDAALLSRHVERLNELIDLNRATAQTFAYMGDAK